MNPTPPIETGQKQAIWLGDFTRIYDPSFNEPKPWYINDHCFVRDHHRQWHLFGITHAEPLNPMDEKSLAHATARTLTQTPWHKHPPAATADFVRWNEHHMWAPCVVNHNGLYYMFVCVGGESNDRYKIHLLTSEDMWTWERHPANPMIVDGYDARDPHVMRIGNEWVMYYTATLNPKGGHHIVACQTSKDLIHWTGRKPVYIDKEVGTYGGPTESPFVVRRRSYYYLFICNNDRRQGYDASDVFRSKDPFLWDASQWVATIGCHAPEIICDDDGQWYASHCGWGRGGVYLAPLYWEDDAE